MTRYKINSKTSLNRLKKCEYTVGLEPDFHTLRIPVEHLPAILERGHDGIFPSELSSRSAWSGRLNLADAKGMLAEGWTTSRPTLTLSGFPGAAVTEQSLTLQTEGAYPDVSAYLSGDSECMVAYVESPTDSPKYCHICVDVAATANVSAKTMFKRGELILSFIDALEAQGIRTRLEVCCNVSDYPFIQRTLVSLKDYAEPIDEGLICFALGHPAMFRRIFFGVADVLHHEGTPMLLAEAQDDARNSTARNPPRPDCDVYVAGFTADYDLQSLQDQLSAYISDAAKG